MSLRNCNPRHPKASDPDYECNMITGRWNKKKVEKRVEANTPHIPCSMRSKFADDPNYECNHRTGRWIKKRQNKVSEKEKTTRRTAAAVVVGRPCNPSSALAQNPNYECNPLTGRWRKKRVQKRLETKTDVVQGGCDPNHRHANNPLYECNPLTKRWVKKRKEKRVDTPTHIRALLEMYPSLRDVDGIMNYTYADVMNVIEKRLLQEKSGAANKTQKNAVVVKTQTKTLAKQKQKPAGATTWEEECKTMEKTCPMDCDLVGTNWCELDQKDVFFFKEGGKTFCYSMEEVYNIIHTGFTAMDTSYQLPPLTLQLPRDSFNRTPFSRAFFDAFVFKLQKQKSKNLPRKFPEVAYFLRNYTRFFDDPAIQPFLRDQSSNKVQMSKAIESFLTRDGTLKIKREDLTFKWKFAPNKKPRSFRKFIFHF